MSKSKHTGILINSNLTSLPYTTNLCNEAFGIASSSEPRPYNSDRVARCLTPIK